MEKTLYQILIYDFLAYKLSARKILNYCSLTIFNFRKMLLSDCWIFSPSVDASDNLCFKIKMKRWDWNDATKALIYNTYNEWKTLDLEVVWLSEKTDEDEMMKLRGDLGSLMSIYAQNAKIPLQSEIDRLYERNNVSSRRDLTRAQLDEEISRYRAGVDFS